VRPLRLGEEKKKLDRKKPQDENIIVCPIPQGDHKKRVSRKKRSVEVKYEVKYVQ